MSKSIEQFPKDLSSPLIQLKSSVEKNSKLHIKELFALEPERFQNYSVKFDQLFLIIANNVLPKIFWNN